MGLLSKSAGTVDVTKVPLSLKGLVMLVFAFAVIIMAVAAAKPVAAFVQAATGRLANAASQAADAGGRDLGV